MNKTELIQAVALEAHISTKEAALAVDAFVISVKKALHKRERVSLVGFGTWEIKKRAARNGVNPKTGQKIVIPEHEVPRFSAGKELKAVCD